MLVLTYGMSKNDVCDTRAINNLVYECACGCKVEYHGYADCWEDGEINICRWCGVRDSEENPLQVLVSHNTKINGQRVCRKCIKKGIIPGFSGDLE